MCIRQRHFLCKYYCIRTLCETIGFRAINSMDYTDLCVIATR